MKLNIVNSEVTSLRFSELQDAENAATETPQKGKAGFSVSIIFHTDSFFVDFDLSLKTKDDKYLNVIYRSYFETSEPINQEFKSGDFPYVNAPAIAFPFLRAFVANFTLAAGCDPVMLPAVNFVALKDEIKGKLAASH
jgi:preprotein translocase subunit SecB